MMAETDQTTSEGNWHLDKKVPIAMIVTIMIQSGAVLWWASSINERVKVLESANTAATATAPVQADRLTRVESKVESVQRDLAEIKADVKSLIRRPSTP